MHSGWNPRQMNPSKRTGTASLLHEDHWDRVPPEDVPQHSRAADREPLPDRRSCDTRGAPPRSPAVKTKMEDFVKLNEMRGE